jgi:hypothetical protein
MTLDPVCGYRIPVAMPTSHYKFGHLLEARFWIDSVFADNFPWSMSVTAMYANRES